MQDGKNGYVLNLEKGKKPNTENLKNIILETINKKELTEDKKKNAKMLLHSIFDENKNFPKYLEILTKWKIYYFTDRPIMVKNCRIQII